ncbi:N-acetylmuramoyl-L-alanine amidase [Luteimonas sp. 8-5]|uniref:N-acetylmuramoyl-L-alanine amidase n=1 Tax=Luteimonas sp. 8-5 TaxID=3039387 RepID=UPI002436E4DA|nr:N-acetylmuramoyl-L-alanine amidase [Luteimonas sp. 8-5]MDG6348420.1 N-acetylmuramoyl-L-alanine amidase [Luteimonas sp. 8-5]
MRTKGIPIQQLLLALALLAGVCWNLARAGELRGVTVDTGATGTRAEIQLDREVEYRLIPLSSPERLAVDLPGVALRKGLALPSGGGLVRAVRSGHPVPGTTRIVFDLSDKVAALRPRFEPGGNGPRLVLEWPGDGAAAAATPTTAAPAATDPLAILTQGAVTGAQAPEVAPQPAKAPEVLPQPAVMRPLVIAIDAGHGGQDPGSRGPSGTREKDVALAIAKELARQVDATPGMKAYLTRDSDYYIPLNQRARKASAAGADIFLSIHADAWTSPSAKGAGVFVLSTRGASSQRARWLADKENASDIIGGAVPAGKNGDAVLTSVLLDLTQSGNLKASEDAASHILGQLATVGNMHKNHIERANLAVLRTSDKMPAMLVETGFISNPSEEKKLRDPVFQRRLASAILEGVDRYFSRQSPPGTLYALRAEAARSARQGGSP